MIGGDNTRMTNAGGLDYWVGRSARGWTLHRISASFAGSSEFLRKYGTLTNAGFVDRAFQNVFGRSADPSGRGYWTAKLDRGTSRGVVMVDAFDAKVRAALALAIDGGEHRCSLRRNNVDPFMCAAL